MGTLSLVPDGVNGSVSMSAAGISGTVTNPFQDGVTLGLGPFAPAFLADALVNLNGDSITESSGAVTSMTNQGTGGSDYDLDVVVGTGANLKKSISDAMLCYGANGDFPSTPDSVANSIVWDIDIRMLFAADNQAPAGFTTLVGKIGSSTTRSYWFDIKAGGIPQFNSTSDGLIGTVSQQPCTTNTGFVDGTFNKLRVTVDVDNGAGGRDVKFWVEGTDIVLADGSGWDQLGDTVTAATTAGFFDSTSPVEIGSIFGGTAQLWGGSVKECQIYNGIDGTLAVDFNAADYVNRTSDTQFPSSTTGEVWTLNGNTFIQNTGHDVVHSIGGVGLETTAGQDIASPGTVFVVAKTTNASVGATQVLFAERSNSAKSWIIQLSNATPAVGTIFQGVAAVNTTETLDDDVHVYTGQFNGDASTKLTISDIGNISGDAGADVWDYGTLFVNRAGASPFIGYIAALYVFDRQLTESEITNMQSYLLSAYKL
jgi:hypothetical protein